MEELEPTIEDEEIIPPEDAEVPGEDDIPVIEDEPETETPEAEAEVPVIEDVPPVAEIPEVTPPVAEKPAPEALPDIETLEVFKFRGEEFPVSADGDVLEDARFDDPASEEAAGLWEFLREEYGDQAQAWYNHYYAMYQSARGAYEAKRAGDYLTVANAGFKAIEPAQAATRTALLAELGGDAPTAEKVFTTYEPKAAELIQKQRTELAAWFENEHGIPPSMAKAKADAAIFAVPNLWDRAVTQAISEDRAGFIKLVKSANPAVTPPAAPAKPAPSRPAVPPMSTGSAGGGAKPALYLLPAEKQMAKDLGIKDMKAFAEKCRANDRAKGR